MGRGRSRVHRAGRGCDGLGRQAARGAGGAAFAGACGQSRVCDGDGGSRRHGANCAPRRGALGRAAGGRGRTRRSRTTPCAPRRSRPALRRRRGRGKGALCRKPICPHRESGEAWIRDSRSRRAGARGAGRRQSRRNESPRTSRFHVPHCAGRRCRHSPRRRSRGLRAARYACFSIPTVSKPMASPRSTCATPCSCPT
jgi:hypothetical protein